MNTSDNSCVCFTCKDVKMTLLKGKHSLLRYLGFIAAIFATLQALMWIGMCISGIICFYIKCGIRQPANRFGKAFNNIYLSTNLSKHYPHFLKPIIFHVLLWFFMILLAVWLFASVSLIVDYRKWANAKRLRKSSKRWIVVTIIVCVLDLLLFVLFVVDFSMLKTGDVGAAVRSMNVEDYDGEIEPYEPFNPYDEFYDSDRNTIGNDTFPSTTALSQEPGDASEGPTTPALTFKERLHYIEELFALKNAEVDERIKELLAEAKFIRETELGTHYNPYVRARVDKLMDQLEILEKLFATNNKTEDELNEERMLAEKEKNEEQSTTTTTEAGTTQTVANQTEASDEHYPANDTYQNDEADPGRILQDHEEELYSSDNAKRNFDRLLQKLKDFNDAPKIKDSLAENRANSEDDDDYNDMWRSTFRDEDYGIILQNDGPGTGWRKITAMDQGSATGTDVMLAPSAMLMTLAIRGYVLWIMNLTAALMLLYLYITRPRRPTLITRVQA